MEKQLTEIQEIGEGQASGHDDEPELKTPADLSGFGIAPIPQSQRNAGVIAGLVVDQVDEVKANKLETNGTFYSSLHDSL